MMPKKIRIGIDVDGVLRDFGFQFAQYVRQFYNKSIKPDDYKEYGFPNVKVGDRKIITDVFANDQAANFVFGNAPPIENAKTGYRFFINQPEFEIYIVSNQKPRHQRITDRWLEENGFTDHVETFYERNKLKAPVQVIIDDKPENVKKFVENQRDGFLINAPYNQDFNYSLRSDDLIDAYKLLKDYYRKYVQSINPGN